MNRGLPSTALLLCAVPSALLWSQATVIDGVSGVVSPGSVLTLKVTGAATTSVQPHAVNNLNKKVPVISGDKTEEGIKIVIPALDPGYYSFSLVDGDRVTDIPGSIDVEPDKITLLSAHPDTTYESDSNTFALTGDNFSESPENDHVSVDGQEIEFGSRVKGDEQACKSKTKPCLAVQNSRAMHVVGYSPGKYQGISTVGVRVGNKLAADTKQLIFSRHSGTAVTIFSAAVTAILFWIVSLVVREGLKGNLLNGRPLKLWESFIFDNETNSYSLSKFQLLVFSCTFLFGYIYVLLSSWLVQWTFALPDLPSTIAGLLGISAGTTVASAGLTAARGAKGAAGQTPKGADLISTGGVVAPERFQFFVWTLVACGGFIAILVGQDPAKVTKFPDIPQGLLYVMGVSAVGYLGGKAARNPGPVLELVGVKYGAESCPWPTLLVQGQNLASNGRFFIDDQELTFSSEEDKKAMRDPSTPLIKTNLQVGASDTAFCTNLEIVVANSSVDLRTKADRIFRITNRDGQFASVAFQTGAVDPSITAVYEQGKDPVKSGPKKLRVGAGALSVLVQGTGLTKIGKIEWKAPDAVDFSELKVSDGSPGNGSRILVSLVPGTKVGNGVLRITTDSACAQTDVKIGGDDTTGAALPTEPSPTQPPTKSSSADDLKPKSEPVTGQGSTPVSESNAAAGSGAQAPTPGPLQGE